ncbi:MAG: CsgG/HfaB family protein [Planctomycetota bacterium]|nr:CsgG/HfaB family protein [Planctomycetota bacterium]
MLTKKIQCLGIIAASLLGFLAPSQLEAATKVVVAPLRSQSNFTPPQNTTLSNPSWRVLTLTTKSQGVTVTLDAAKITPITVEMLNNSGSYACVVRKKQDKILFRNLFTEARTIEQGGAIRMGKFYDARYIIVPEITAYKCRVSPLFGSGNNAHRVLDLALTVEFTVVDTKNGRVVFRQSFKGVGQPKQSCQTQNLSASDLVWTPVKKSLCKDFVKKFLKATLKPLPEPKKDTTGPSISILSPAKGSYCRSDRLRVAVACPDKDLSYITINGQAAKRYPNAKKVPVYIATLECLDGPVKIRVTAQDKSGNKTIKTSQIICDTKAPLVHVVSPDPNVAVNTASVTIVAVCLDKDVASLTIAGKECNRGAKNRFSHTIQLKQGFHRIDVKAKDHAGNERLQIASFSVDCQKPTLTLISPKDKAQVKTKSVEVKVECPDTDLLSIKVNGQTARFVRGRTYAAPFNAQEGLNNVVVVAIDKAGNKTQLFSSFTVDAKPPTLKLLAPKRKARLNTNPINVWVECKDSDLESITINGVKAKSRGKGRYSIALIAKQGVNKIHAVARDKAGHETALKARFTFDSKAPEISAKLTVIIQGKVDDPQSKVTINGVPVKVGADGHYKQEVKLGADRKVVIVATDPFGNAKRVVKQY